MEVLDRYAEQILVTPDELAAALREHERQAAVLALAIAHVHNSGRWADDGSVTMRAWMRNHLRMTDREAGIWLRRAGLLDRNAAFADAALEGVLSESQLHELDKCDTPHYRDLLHEHQDALVEQLAKLDAADTAIACGVWRQRADAIIEAGEPPLEPVRELRTVRADDGTLLVRGSFDDAAATELEKALANALDWDSDDTRTVAQRQGDAWYDIAAFYNRNHDGAGTPRHHAHISLSLDESTLSHPAATNDDTGRLTDPDVTRTHLCDCIIHPIVRDVLGYPVAYGRSQYTVPRRLFKQVAARDGGCRFPGCTRPVKHTEAHHIIWWEHGGTTEIANLVLLCSRHHHLVHQQHLHLTLHPTGELDVEWHDGRVRTSHHRGAPPKATAPPGHPA